MTIASEIVGYIINNFKKDFPEDVKNIGIHAIVDQYGLQIAGSQLPAGKVIYNIERKYHRSTGHSTVTRYGDKIAPLNAAFINATFAHAKDFDDCHQEAQIHPGSIVIPAAMAIAECMHHSPRVVLQAIIWGMEIMLRLAHSISPACMAGGHHTCPTIGPFGAAIACGLLMDLSESQLTHALAICGSYSGALVEFTLSGGSVKRIYPALGARAGLEAVLLAKEGITGPSTIIEGKKGIWSTFGGAQIYPERLFDKIGTNFLISSLIFKKYSCCLFIHPAIDAFLELCHTHKILSKNIKTVSVGLSKLSASHVGSITIPQDELSAQFSTSFMLALSLLQETPQMWTSIEEALMNSKILSLASRITIYVDDETEFHFPKHNGCVVNIITYQENIYTLRLKNAKGSEKGESSLSVIKNKFINNTVPVVGLEQATDLYQTLINFAKLKSVKLILTKMQPRNKYPC